MSEQHNRCARRAPLDTRNEVVDFGPCEVGDARRVGHAALERIRNRQRVGRDSDSGIQQLTFEEKPGKGAVPGARVDEESPERGSWP